MIVTMNLHEGREGHGAREAQRRFRIFSLSGDTSHFARIKDLEVYVLQWIPLYGVGGLAGSMDWVGWFTWSFPRARFKAMKFNSVALRRLSAYRVLNSSGTACDMGSIDTHADLAKR
jgi:hypothetical protein